MHIAELIRAQRTACIRYNISYEDLFCVMDIGTLRDIQYHLSISDAYRLFGSDPGKPTHVLGSELILAFPEPKKVGCIFLPKP